MALGHNSSGLLLVLLLISLMKAETHEKKLFSNSLPALHFILYNRCHAAKEYIAKSLPCGADPGRQVHVIYEPRFDFDWRVGLD